MASIKSLLILATVLAVAVLLTPSLGLGDQTAEFRARFMKKCDEFTQEGKDCGNIWITFQKAYVGKDPCEVTDNNYDELFTVAPIKGPCDKTVFYSGVIPWAHEFTEDRDLIVVHDTLLGHILAEESWWGKVGSHETYTEHTEYIECPSGYDPRTWFWKAASIKFAQFACKEAIVMLNKTLSPPYIPGSFFQQYEVPNFLPSKLQTLTVILLTTNSRNSCSCDSLGDLRTDLHEDIGCTCHEVPLSRLQECINRKIPTAECWK